MTCRPEDLKPREISACTAGASKPPQEKHTVEADSIPWGTLVTLTLYVIYTDTGF